MAISAGENCNSCAKGRHAHQNAEGCDRRMWGGDYFCPCNEPLTARVCIRCRRQIRGGFAFEGHNFRHAPFCPAGGATPEQGQIPFGEL
jgi:hypothetical protein